MLERVESLQDAHSIITDARTEVYARGGADEVWGKILRIEKYIKQEQVRAMQE